MKTPTFPPASVTGARLASFAPTLRPLAVMPFASAAAPRKQVFLNSHWLWPLAILCCMVNAVSADTFGLFTYSINGSTIAITDYPDTATGDVVIPANIVGKPVTSIGDSAFQNCMNLTSINIPDGVTSIGGFAFQHCNSLTSISIPDSVTSIGNYAFGYCRSLTSVTIPDGVTDIRSTTFLECTSLTSVTIPNSVTSIGGQAFQNCVNLSSIRIPDSVTSIGRSAFIFCGRLTSVTIPASVTSIEDQAFVSCGSMNTAIFQGNAPTMGWNVFYGTASGFTAYYVNGMTGFSTPLWNIWKQGQFYTVRAFPGIQPQFTSAVPPSTGKVNTAFSHTCSTTGTPAPTFAVTSGALPDGLYLSAAGVIYGYPTAASIFTGTITASNGIPPDATQAFFIDTNEYRTVVVGATNGTVTGGGIYLLNATATLTATPSPGYLFTEWTGDASGTDNPLSVQMNADKTIGATFSPDTNDTDDDGFTNYEEIVIHGTNPTLADTDGDNVKDSKDAFPLDPAETLDTDHDGTGDNADTDDDGDGLSDVDEVNIYGTNSKRADSDGDGLSDPAELQTTLTNPNVADSDTDGLSDGAEVNTHGTNPKVADTDGDGFLDGYEVLTGHFPLDILDKPALVAEARTAIEFTFPSAIGKTYRIEDSPDMTNWSTVEDGIAGIGGVVTRFYTTRNQPKRFFRVEEQTSP